MLSYQPLKVYLYREGFARFTNTPYSTAKSDLKNPYVHLTNHAIQKRDVDYDPSVDDLKTAPGRTQDGPGRPQDAPLGRLKDILDHLVPRTLNLTTV